MKIHTIIPARGGSESIPDKNIISLGGYPLIAYTIAVAKLSKYVDQVVVSTDSSKIASVVEKFGGHIPFLRPAEISQKYSLDIEFFRHYIEFIHSKDQEIPDLIVHLRPTSPLRDIRVVDRAIKFMMENEGPTALRSMHKTPLTPYKMFKLKDEYAAPFLSYEAEREFYNLPRQSFETAYIPNGYVDVLRPSVLLKTGLLHGERMKIWETPNIPDIDCWEDYAFAKTVYKETQYKYILEYLERI